MRFKEKLSSLKETNEFGSIIGSNLKGGEIIAFSSDLGGGKTTIIKSIVKAAGSDDLVSSPTFTICNNYQSKNLTIYHFDFYRLSDPGIIKLEIEEYLEDKSAVILIEWPAVIESILPRESLVKIDIEVLSGDQRDLEIDCLKKLGYLFKGAKVC